MARWQSGDAADCKSVYVGSIPARASIPILSCDERRRQASLSRGFFVAGSLVWRRARPPSVRRRQFSMPNTVCVISSPVLMILDEAE
jgi:hypothetical protein